MTAFKMIGRGIEKCYDHERRTPLSVTSIALLFFSIHRKVLAKNNHLCKKHKKGLRKMTDLHKWEMRKAQIPLPTLQGHFTKLLGEELKYMRRFPPPNSAERPCGAGRVREGL
jgi:hypothetical protein